jgi:hypothetical protein
MAARKPSRWDGDAVPLAVVIVTTGLRAWYAIALLSLSFGAWYATWRGPDMRIAAILNVGAVVILVISTMLRRHDLVMGACLVALLLHGLPGARVGEGPIFLLPWATATTALVMLDAASRRSRELVAATGVGLVAFGAWLAVTLSWAALDYYIAAAAIAFASALIALIRDRQRWDPTEARRPGTQKGQGAERPGP